MKKNWIAMLLLCAVLNAAPAACLTGCGTAGENDADASDDVVSEGFIVVPPIYNYVKLSSTPDEYGETLEQLTGGVKVGILASMEGWFKVQYGSKTGYVRSGCVTFSAAEHEAISTAKATETTARQTTQKTTETAAETTELTAADTTVSAEQTGETATGKSAEKTTDQKTEKTTASTSAGKPKADGEYEIVFDESELLKAADLRYEGHVFFSQLSNITCNNGTGTAIVDPQYIEGEYFEVEKGIRVTGASAGNVTVKGTLTPYRWELSVADDPTSKIVIYADAPIEFTVSATLPKE